MDYIEAIIFTEFGNNPTFLIQRNGIQTQYIRVPGRKYMIDNLYVSLFRDIIFSIFYFHILSIKAILYLDFWSKKSGFKFFTKNS